ncbi:MAG: type II toxin-antitoxin system RelE/ParE family toxin [Sulfurospirillaceae bacterium]|nr:type II toxin-antitoxin system RelE/ParE family toxin [Sulfurospirillaceae bacterium]
MIIEKKPTYLKNLFSILKYIASDKPSASSRFEKELEQKLEDLRLFPLQYKASFYFKNDAYRDMIFDGYTVIYKVQTDKILILDIFKWQNRSF